MSTTILSVKDASVKQILSLVSLHKPVKEVQAIVSETIEFTGTNWDSGYKREYTVVDLTTMRVVPVPNQPSPWHQTQLHSDTHNINPGYAVVVWQWAGTRHWVEIWGHPQTVSGLITKTPELSRDEMIVLCCTRSYKSSYGGIPQYRQYMAMGKGMSSIVWEETKQKLIERKLLNKAGALTIDGKNAIGFKQLHEI